MRKTKAVQDVRQPFLKRAVAPLICVLALFYLGFHTVSGERGIVALFKETQRLEQVKAELEEVTAERKALDARVSRLSDASLDLDLLDERARVVLGYAARNEVVIFTNKQ